MEQLNERHEDISQLPNDNGWSDFSPFQGNKPTEQNNSMSEAPKTLQIICQTLIQLVEER